MTAAAPPCLFGARGTGPVGVYDSVDIVLVDGCNGPGCSEVFLGAHFRDSWRWGVLAWLVLWEGCVDRPPPKAGFRSIGGGPWFQERRREGGDGEVGHRSCPPFEVGFLPLGASQFAAVGNLLGGVQRTLPWMVWRQALGFFGRNCNELRAVSAVAVYSGLES